MTTTTEMAESFEAGLTIDEQLSSLRARVLVVLNWHAANPVSLVPPLTVRADMLAVAAAFQSLDLWVSEGGPLPSAWTENRGSRELEGRWLRPELIARQELIPSTIVQAFVELETPVSVPTEPKAARLVLSEWLREHARPVEGQRFVWEVPVVNNGAYVVRTDGRGVIREITYEAR